MSILLDCLLLASLFLSGNTHIAPPGPNMSYSEQWEPCPDASENSFDHYYVHLVLHTHDDVGWLKTPDQYFSGTAMNTIQYAGVETILDSVINELLLDPQRKFSYVEMKFLSMWWELQTEEMKDDVRTLVREGRLEIVNAGWSMHDEACPHYEDMINNMMAGHQFALREFGVAPRIGWQIDPFGHSNANARLFAEMGFDAMFFTRLDYQDKNQRLDESEMELIWRPFYDSLGTEAQIFTHIFYQFYYSPGGFNFDIDQEDDPFIDDQDLETFNADYLSGVLYNLIQSQKNHYRTDQLLIVFGGDFCFMNAKMYYFSMDHLITYFNNKYPDVTLLYSTPSQFVDALNDQDISWPTKYDDFFPYADYDVSMWTGYFTSRSNDKEYIRRASHNHQASSYLYSLECLKVDAADADISSAIDTNFGMLDALGVNQHHDAVTGTGKQHVANDYARIIFEAMEPNNQLYSQKVQAMAEKVAALDGSWQWCFKENTTYLDCPIADHLQENFFIAVHNPSLVSLQYARFSSSHANYDVNEYNYQSGQFEVVEADALCDSLLQNDGSTVFNCDIVVETLDQGEHFTFLQVIYNAQSDISATKTTYKLDTPLTIESDYESLSYLNSNDFAEQFQLIKKEYDQTLYFSFDLKYWPSYGSYSSQSSGVYIFRPQDGVYESSKYSLPSSVSAQVGSISSQILITYVNQLTGTKANVFARMFRKQRFSEWRVDLLGIPDTGEGMEVTVNFQSLDINNKNTFYTDSNGLQMQKRVLNYRPTWDWSGPMNISGNYYPVQTAMFIRDTTKKLQMTVMNSRSQGGSVLQKGRIELMQQRRMYYDDWKGMGEGLNEMDEDGNPIAVSALYYFQLFNYNQETSVQREVQLIQDQPAQNFFSFDSQLTQSSPVISRRRLAATEYPSTLKVSLIPIQRNKIHIRLANLADPIDSNSAASIQVDIQALAQELFEQANGDSSMLESVVVREMSLTGNMELSEMKARKINWKTDDDLSFEDWNRRDENESLVTLERQRIRAFELEYTLTH